MALAVIQALPTAVIARPEAAHDLSAKASSSESLAGQGLSGTDVTPPSSHSIVCDEADISHRFAEAVAGIGRAGGGTITFDKPGQTCRSKGRTTVYGDSGVSYIITNGARLLYDQAPLSLALIRNDIINLKPAMTWAKYSQARSNDYTGFFYMFDDHVEGDRNDRQKAALLAICSSADNSPGSPYFHDCVGGELDSDNPFGAAPTRQWGLTANVAQKVAGGDGLMTGGEFDVTLVDGSIEQNSVDQTNSKIGISSICITQKVNCTAGLYFNLAHDGTGGKFYDGIVFKPTVFRRSAFCELAPNSTTSCQAALGTNGVFEARAILANAAGAPTIHTGSCPPIVDQAGGSAGSFSMSSCPVGNTIKFVFPVSAPSGWTCNVQDMTSEDTEFRESSYDATSCTVKILRRSTSSGDKITFSSTAF